MSASSREPQGRRSPIPDARRTAYFDDRGETYSVEWELTRPPEAQRPNGLKAAVAGVRPAGIGEAVVWRLAADGYRVVCCDRDQRAGLQAVEWARRDGAAVEFIDADVSTAAGVERFMDEIARHPGPLATLVCNAGSAGNPREDDLLELTADQLHRLLDDNLVSAYLLSRHALKRFFLRQGTGGSVIFIGSNNGQRGFGLLGQPGYGMAKAGLSALLANLVARFGHAVRFNLVRSGVVVTNSENWQRRLQAAKDWPQLEGSYTPAGRLGKPADVANAVAWLASDAAGWVSGAELPVDGGVSCAGLQFPAFDVTNFRESYVHAVREWKARRERKVA
jgi:NAD(P)-dependent dehydrogenase (short-subunit alcohol dehydrogenase family)